MLTPVFERKFNKRTTLLVIAERVRFAVLRILVAIALLAAPSLAKMAMRP